MDKEQKSDQPTRKPAGVPDQVDVNSIAGSGRPARKPAGVPDPARRSLLKAAPLGALAVAAAASAKEAEAPAAAPAPDPAKPRGYHETEHIRNYYRTAAYW
jgi:hypothetical protein